MQLVITNADFSHVCRGKGLELYIIQHSNPMPQGLKATQQINLINTQFSIISACIVHSPFGPLMSDIHSW